MNFSKNPKGHFLFPVYMCDYEQLKLFIKLNIEN